MLKTLAPLTLASFCALAGCAASTEEDDRNDQPVRAQVDDKELEPQTAADTARGIVPAVISGACMYGDCWQPKQHEPKGPK
jgi:hypothetical protein